MWVLIAVSLYLSTLLQGAASEPQQQAQEVVAAVSKNVKEFQDSLPDFLCDE
jgi:hypothetical protein